MYIMTICVVKAIMHKIKSRLDEKLRYGLVKRIWTVNTMTRSVCTVIVSL